MRAKRSKKYRKLMVQYAHTFGFREPYQVLVDSHFLTALHSYKIDLVPALERTLQGQVKPMITKCTLNALLSSNPDSNATNRRPPQLPPPTVLPLRHCTHALDSASNPDGNTTLDEVSCLLSLVSSNKHARATNMPETKKNKEHYILATADPVRDDKVPVPRGPGLRNEARQIPGVPIIYVKRSVVVLEPMSSVSEDIRNGHERGKLRAGIINTKKEAGTKRKRDDDADESDEDGDGAAEKRPKTHGNGHGGARAGGGAAAAAGVRGLKKAKGPNPLSMKKKKKPAPSGGAGTRPRKRDGEAKTQQQDGRTDSAATGAEDASGSKTKRKRKHKSSKTEGDAGGVAVPAEA